MYFVYVYIRIENALTKLFLINNEIDLHFSIPNSANQAPPCL